MHELNKPISWSELKTEIAKLANDKAPDIPAWAGGSERNTLVFPMLGVTGSRPQFRKPNNFLKGRLQMFRPTRSSKFSRCWVMVSWGVLVHKNYVPCVTSEVTESPRLCNWCPRVRPLFVLLPGVVAYISVHSSLVIVMHVTSYRWA